MVDAAVSEQDLHTGLPPIGLKNIQIKRMYCMVAKCIHAQEGSLWYLDSKWNTWLMDRRIYYTRLANLYTLSNISVMSLSMWNKCSQTQSLCIIHIYYRNIPVSVELRLDEGNSAECVIVKKSSLLYYTRVEGLAWPRPCGIDMLKSFVLSPGQNTLQILRPMREVGSLFKYWKLVATISPNALFFL